MSNERIRPSSQDAKLQCEKHNISPPTTRKNRTLTSLHSSPSTQKEEINIKMAKSMDRIHDNLVPKIE
jgi:hypothetical protein